jgi:tetratricopeptide (TPR) repeat protein
MLKKTLHAVISMIKRYAFLLMISVLACTMSIAKEKSKKPLPINLPGMQNFAQPSPAAAPSKNTESKKKLEEILFTPEELKDILKETQQKQAESAPAVQPSVPAAAAEVVSPPAPVTKAASVKHAASVVPAAPVVSEAAPAPVVSATPVAPAPIPVETTKPAHSALPVPARAVKKAKAPHEKSLADNDTARFFAPEPKPVYREIKPAIVKDDSHFRAGIESYAQRDLRKAIKEFELAVDVNGEDTDAYYMLADAYYQLFDMENAWKNIRMAVELSGGKKTPLYHAIQKEIAKPFTVSLTAVLIIVTGLSVMFMLIQWILLRKKSASSVQHDELELLKKEIEIIKMKNDIHDPRVRYYKALEACQNGDTMLALNNIKSAEEEYRTAMVLYPQIVNAYLGLGYIHFSQKKYDSAIHDYARALDIDPHCAVAYYGLGRAVGEKGDAKAQFEKIKMAVDLDPQFREATEALSYLQRLAA